ncbi:MAG: aminotransferase class IV [Candidatus Omnitrophota bacterium]
MKVWINGRCLCPADAKIAVYDRGFLYGDGLFETMRSFNGKVFKLDEHLSRLWRSARVLRIKVPYPKKRLKAAVCRTLDAAGLKDAYIRLMVTRGGGIFTFRPGSLRAAPSVVIIVKKFGPYPARLYSSGISAKISGIKQDESSPLAGIKSLNFLKYILARIDARESGFDDAILLNTKGNVAEAATSNIFLVRRGRLITPSLMSGALPGITRDAVIRMAKKMRISVKERVVFRRELFSADEIFFTGSLAGILPVAKIGGHPVGRGRPGEVTRLLYEKWEEAALSKSNIRKKIK